MSTTARLIIKMPSHWHMNFTIKITSHDRLVFKMEPYSWKDGLYLDTGSRYGVLFVCIWLNYLIGRCKCRPVGHNCEAVELESSHSTATFWTQGICIYLILTVAMVCKFDSTSNGRYTPADTRCNNNVIITSKRRRDVVLTYNDVIIASSVG